ncbi:hypothetical protein DFQ27_003916 [Actinomortierella ambigua]|uniref:C2H2-type domain-containing protein n=1 Tax=Actinomortierella ambigua TaxID=1343610 RepID=A0A9P6Q5B6_9FUNG|nr:hypothetical protein DFQ27_003916 [Actinomortierella ambigua]
MPTPPAQPAYPSPPPHSPRRMDDEHHEDVVTPLIAPSPSTPDNRDVHRTPRSFTTPTSSLPSPSSPWLNDFDSNGDRFDPDYGGFRVQSPATNHSHQQHCDLESAFCRNFSCCGLNLRDLHDLLQHYEECHVRFEDDDDSDSLSGEEGSGLDSSLSSHHHVTAPLALGLHHRPRYHRLTAISDTYPGGLLDTMGIGMGIGMGIRCDPTSSIYDDDDSWSESDSSATSPSSRSPSLSSVAMGAASPSIAAAIQGGHAGSRSLQLPFLTSPHDNFSATHAQELVSAGFVPCLKRKAGVSLADIYAEDNLDHHFHHQGNDTAFANTILRLRSNNTNINKHSTLGMPSSMDHLSSVALKKQALENSQRAHAAAAMLTQSNILCTGSGGDGNGMPSHAPAPQAQQALQPAPGFRSSTLHDHPPFPLGHPQHPQTHPLARSHHPLVPSLPHSAGETSRLPFGTIPSVLMTTTHRHNMIPGPLQTSLNHALLPDMTTAEMLRQRDEAFSLIEDMSRNPGACSQGDKPYRCAVLGCDKAYKNPNGLKYHNQHGHCSSLGMCDTDAPGSKPYVCTFLECGKRYKNLNGLKYHIEHSHPNLTAALRAHQSGLMNNLLLYSPYPNQAAMTIAAALAAVQASPMMMAAANAILTAAANNNASTASSNSSGNSNGATASKHGNGGDGGENIKSSSLAPVTPTSAAPVTPVSTVPLTLNTAPSSSPCTSAVSSAPPTATTVAPVTPLSAAAAAAVAAVSAAAAISAGPILPHATTTTCIPSVLSEAIQTVHLSSAPISAIPIIQAPPPPRLHLVAGSAVPNVTTSKETDEDADVDVGGDATVESLNNLRMSDAFVNNKDKDIDIDIDIDDDDAGQVGPGSTDDNEASSTRNIASLSPFPDSESAMMGDRTASPMTPAIAAVNRKSRHKHTTTTTTTTTTATAIPVTSLSPTSSSVIIAVTTEPSSAVTAGERKDRRRVHRPENTDMKVITAGSSSSSSSSSAATVVAVSTAQIPLDDDETEDEQGEEEEEDSSTLSASPKTGSSTRLTTRSLASDTKPPASPPTPSASASTTMTTTTTMVTRSNRQQQLQQRPTAAATAAAEDKEKEAQPSPPMTRRSRK